MAAARSGRRARPPYIASGGSPPRRLLRTTDHGAPIAVRGTDIGASGDRWAEAFLLANASSLRRMDFSPEVRMDREVRVILAPGSRIGAIPLLCPATRKVAAGVLVEPRFTWSALGAVFSAIGFGVEPTVGGAPLVPGSAREVPPWMLAGPVLERLASLLGHRRRGFVEQREVRFSPRGRIEWQSWATGQLARGQWTSFPCHFSEPDDDPELIANVRWTLRRLWEQLATVSSSTVGRCLLRSAADLLQHVGPGQERRPSGESWAGTDSAWLREGIEAMAWVAEERGLGGSWSLDGLSWDLAIESVWEAWVAAFAAPLAVRLGMVALPPGATRRAIRWAGPAQSMGSLNPDIELRAEGRVIWIDAKYKAHYGLLARHGWHGLSERVRDDHRADLHQALAYASLADAEVVDTVLAYPQLAGERRQIASVATVTSGRRRVRLILASIPFGFRSPTHQEEHTRALREVLVC